MLKYFLIVIFLKVGTCIYCQTNAVQKIDVRYSTRVEAKEVLKCNEYLVVVSEVDSDKYFQNPISKTAIYVEAFDSSGKSHSTIIDNCGGSSTYSDALVSDSLIYVLITTNTGVDIFSHIIVVNAVGTIKGDLKIRNQISGKLTLDPSGAVLLVAYDRGKDGRRPVAYVYIINHTGTYEQKIVSSSLAINGLNLISSSQGKWTFYGEVYPDSINIVASSAYCSLPAGKNYRKVKIVYDIKKELIQSMEILELPDKLVFIGGDSAGLFFEKYFDEKVVLYVYRQSTLKELLSYNRTEPTNFAFKSNLSSSVIFVMRGVGISDVYDVSNGQNPVKVFEKNFDEFTVDDLLDAGDLYILEHKVDYLKKASITKVFVKT